MAPPKEINVDNNNSWMVPIQVMLGTTHHKEIHASSILKVADKIRKPNKDAFVPKVVSIGPYHRGSENEFSLMEQAKWSYMFSLLVESQPQDEKENTKKEIGNAEEIQNRPNKTLEKCGAAMLGLDDIVRASYGGSILSEPHEVAKTMLLDGFFLLEFLLRLHEYKEALDGNNINDDDDRVWKYHHNFSPL